MGGLGRGQNVLLSAADRTEEKLNILALTSRACWHLVHHTSTKLGASAGWQPLDTLYSAGTLAVWAAMQQPALLWCCTTERAAQHH